MGATLVLFHVILEQGTGGEIAVTSTTQPRNSYYVIRISNSCGKKRTGQLGFEPALYCLPV